MTIEVLSPTWEGSEHTPFRAAPRPKSLAELRVGVISNGKKGTQPFFEALANALEGEFGAREVKLLTKANYSAPAETEIFDQAQEWNALISGIGD